MLRLHIPSDCQIDVLPAIEITEPAAEAKESKLVAFVSSTDKDYQLYRLDSAKHIVEFKAKTSLNISLHPSKEELILMAGKNKLACIHSPKWIDLKVEIIDFPDELKNEPAANIPLTPVEVAGQIIESKIIAKNAEYRKTANPNEVFLQPSNGEEAFLFNIKTGTSKKTILIGKSFYPLPDGRMLDVAGSMFTTYNSESGTIGIEWNTSRSWLSIYNPITNTTELMINKYDMDKGFATMLRPDEFVCRDVSEGKKLLVFNTSDFTKPITTISLDYVCVGVAAFGNDYLIVKGLNGIVEVFQRKENVFIKTQVITDELAELTRSKTGSVRNIMPRIEVIGAERDTLIILPSPFINLISCWRMAENGKLQNTTSTSHPLSAGLVISELKNSNQFILSGTMKGAKRAATLWNTELKTCLGVYSDFNRFPTFLSNGQCIIEKDENIHLLEYSPFAADSVQKYIDDSVPEKLASTGKTSMNKGVTGIISSYLFCPEKKSQADREIVAEKNVSQPTLQAKPN